MISSYLPKFQTPIPGFSAYTGPHKVGTIDVELPVSELESPAPAADDTIPTIQYRIFYPCEQDAKGAHADWLPAPQRGYVSAYTRFLGAGSILAEVISFFPRLLHYIAIPSIKDAPILTPTTESGRWPVMVFSHGLGGSRNAYSHLLGSIASHGVVVIATEHRDGSTPISYIRETAPTPNSEKSYFRSASQRTIAYNRISHTPSPEVEAGRNAQLKIRLWELGLVHDSLLKIDEGRKVTNLNKDSAALSMLSNIMDVHTAGKITFAGHSFGAATVAQFVKSTYYSPQISTAPSTYETLFSPSSRSSIVSQITPRTPLILLDMWCLPLRAASTRWLWDQPLPCYAPGGQGGSSLLAIDSETFYNWRIHLKATKRFLSPDPSSDEYNFKNGEVAEPNFFYAEASAHLSQSDFGLLFPWVAKKVFQAEEPERVMRLNVRAVLQLLRENSIPVAATSEADMEIGGDEQKVADVKESDGMEVAGDRILERTSGDEGVRGWKWLDTDVASLMDVDFRTAEEGKTGLIAQAIEQPKAIVGGELMKDTEGTAEVL